MPPHGAALPEGETEALISRHPQCSAVPTIHIHLDAPQVPTLHPLPRASSSYSAQLQGSQNPESPMLLAVPEPTLLSPRDFTSLASLESTCFSHCSRHPQVHGLPPLTTHCAPSLISLPVPAPQSFLLSQLPPPKSPFSTPDDSSLLKNLPRLTTLSDVTRVVSVVASAWCSNCCLLCHPSPPRTPATLTHV